MECIKCKKAVVDKISRCANCTNVFHKSCAKCLKGVKNKSGDFDIIICQAHSPAPGTPNTEYSNKSNEISFLRAENDNLLKIVASLREEIDVIKTFMSEEIKKYHQLFTSQFETVHKEISNKFQLIQNEMISINSKFNKFNVESNNHVLQSHDDLINDVTKLNANNQNNNLYTVNNESNFNVNNTSLNLMNDNQNKKINSKSSSDNKLKINKHSNNISLRGTGTTFQLAAANKVPRKWYHINNIKPKTSVNDLKLHLSEQLGISDVICSALTSNEKFCSFKIGILDIDESKILDQNLWPTNVIIRKFFFRKSHPVSNNIPTSQNNPPRVQLGTDSFLPQEIQT